MSNNDNIIKINLCCLPMKILIEEIYHHLLNIINLKLTNKPLKHIKRGYRFQNMLKSYSVLIIYLSVAFSLEENLNLGFLRDIDSESDFKNEIEEILQSRRSLQ